MNSIKKVTANDNKYYFGYLNKSVDECNNTYHCSTGKKNVDIDYSALSEEIETNHKSPKYQVGDRVRITKYKKKLAKVTPKIGQEKYLLMILC